MVSHAYACPHCAELKQQLDYAIELLKDARHYCDTVSTGDDITEFTTSIAASNWTPPRPMTPQEIDQFIARTDQLIAKEAADLCQ